MGYRHQRGEIVAAALDAAVDDGLSRLTFGRLAKRMGINDRTIVYYFPNKVDLLTAVVEAAASDLQRVLGEAYGTEPLTRDELLRRSWPVLSDASTTTVFGLTFELLGLGAAGIEPFDGLSADVLSAWAAWVASLLTGDEDERMATAYEAMAIVDGLLLLRAHLGPDAADAAARRLGLTAEPPC